MTLILTIENAEILPQGVPASVKMNGTSYFDIGRYADCDWSLPDPRRFISGKHCEIRYQNGTYWLYDVSTNGTYMNGEAARIGCPKPLNNGDRIAIGIYVIAISIEADKTVKKEFSSASDETVTCIGRPFDNLPFKRTVTRAVG